MFIKSLIAVIGITVIDIIFHKGGIGPSIFAILAWIGYWIYVIREGRK